MKSYVNNLSKILLALASFAAPLANASPNIDLRVSAKWPEAFERPLPELLVFNGQGQCVYQKISFESEVQLIEDLDLIFKKGEPPSAEVVLPDSVRQQIEEDIRAQIFANDDIPAAIKETFAQEAVASALTKLTKQLPGCDSSMAQLLELTEGIDGKPGIQPSELVGKIVLVEYHADWCKPCQIQKKVLDKYLASVKHSHVLLRVERDFEKVNPDQVSKIPGSVLAQ